MNTLRSVSIRPVQYLSRTRPTQLRAQRLQSQVRLYNRATPHLQRNQFRSLHSRFQSALKTFRISSPPFGQTTRAFASATEPASTQQLSLSQRLKKLSREYGWTAVGVYFALSALDFPFCFLAVRLLGTDRIGHWEHAVVSTIKEWIKWPLNTEGKDMVDGAVNEVQATLKVEVPVADVENHGGQRILEEESTYVSVDHGYKQASAANKGSDASIWTQLALAYAIHKSFIFIRVPLTAAVLPKVVKTLRSWGYNIGKMPAKKTIPGSVSTSKTGVNTKGSGVKSD